MTRNDLHAHARRAQMAIATAALAIGLAACSDAPTRPEAGGIDVTPKANKNYIVDGRVLSFVELETLVSTTPPTTIVLEPLRSSKGAACIVMLRLRPNIPVWTRTLSGRMHKVKADVKSSDIETIENCR